MKVTLSSSSAVDGGRRSFLTGMAAAALGAAVFDRASAASTRHHIVGCVKPLPPPAAGKADESIEDLSKLLPSETELVPDYLGLTKGTREEMRNSLELSRGSVALLAEKHCELISIEGAPPFMLLGRKGETALINDWKTRYGVPLFTSCQNQVNAFEALKVGKIFGVTEFSGSINEVYADYFRSAGIEVVAMDGMPGISFDKLETVRGPEVYDFIKSHFGQHERADAVYMLGSAWHTFDIIDPLEHDLGVPVIHPIAARAWEIQKRLGIRLPVKGYGRLMSTLPG